ncbi:LysM peptidoglycan-binding domain-containing protein [Nocardioides dongkuii]|uniref:LysM peptidoglycan-binding domain-containing protein n=1 Tax=Nocardioides dongkuii TaxID=2760089 RepID=UPI001877F911|nr:LysM peptidoglycan-binding domain-containing protein [Nocardioides dongkuii]
MRLAKACAAALLLMTLALGVPALLVGSVGSPWPDGGLTSLSLMTDSAVLGLLAIAGWFVWAQFMSCLIVELVGEVRRVPVPKVGPRVQREMARSLVRAVLLIGASATVASSAWHPTSAEATPIAAGTTASTTTSSNPFLAPSLPGANASAPSVHVVQPGDTLWGIAERHLGDGLRWRSIAELNHGRTMTDGLTFRDSSDIRPGWQLELPRRSARTQPSVVVEPGESLSAIAHEELGDSDLWPSLYRANRATIGSDPDVIETGQKLVLPKAQPQLTSTSQHHLPAQPPPPVPPAAETPSPPAETPVDPSAVPSPEEPRGEPTDAADQDERSDDEVPVTAVTAWRAVFATGSCLAVGLMTLLIANRRRQLAARRPGRLVRSSPPELRPVERAIHEIGHDRLDDVTFIDEGLRTLSKLMRGRRQQLPNLGAVVLTRDGLIMKLVGLASHEPPPPWEQRDDDTWFLQRASDLPDDVTDHPAPYPALVSTGVDDEGRLWLLDLEAHGGAGLQLPAGLLRHWVTELASNPWGSSVELLVADQELSSLALLNPERVILVDPELATLRIDALRDDANGRFANLLDLRRDGAVEDATGPVVILGKVQAGEREGRGRDRVVLVASGRRELLAEDAEGWSIADWDIPIKPFGLDVVTFDSVAALLNDTEDVADGPAPDEAQSSDAGRETGGQKQTSLLPAPDPARLAVHGISLEDLARLAPSPTATQRDETRALDPQLDCDLAAWHDPACRRPKVKVLGPVEIIATAGSRDGIRNVGGTVEFIVYLALAERGVTKDRAAEDLGWSGATVQNRARDARRLMGLRPDGTDWLPDAARSEGARLRGVPTYQLHEDVLLDADLLRRLRARAQASGAEGVEDIAAALRLVEGEPFDQLRRGGYGWLLEGDRIDLHLTAAIDDLRLLQQLRESA